MRAESLQLLIVDDSPDDARLVERVLASAFDRVQCRHVESEASLRAALDAGGWHAVLCDHGVPGLSTVETLAEVRRTLPGAPFLVVSGQTDPAAAAALLSAGADGFVRKDRLTSLPLSLRRALDAAARPAAPGRTFVERDRLVRRVLAGVADPMLVTDAAGTIVHANPAAEAAFGVAPGALARAPFADRCELPDHPEGATAAGRGRREAGEFPLEARRMAAPFLGAGHALWTLWDTSERQAIEADLRRREADVRRLIDTMRAGHVLAGRVLAALDSDTAIWRAAWGLGASGGAWRAARVWLTRGAHLQRWERRGEGTDFLPFDAAHPVARAARGAAVWVDDGTRLVVPLRGRGEPLGAIELDWADGGDLAAAPGAGVRAGLREVASAVAAALALALEIHELQAAERVQARRDPLTGLPNRRALRSALKRELARARRGKGSLAVMVVDADGLKSVNDRWGQATGDLALHALARLLLNGFRVVDLVARTGGDEFAVVMPGVGVAGATCVAERLRTRVAKFRFPNPAAPARPVRLTVSIGVCALMPADGDAEAFLARADAACFEAKSAGRNRVAARGLRGAAGSA